MKVNDMEKAQQEFKDKQLQENKAYFEELSKGQSPTFYVLACCDSRTSPTTVTGQPLGRLFIHRNIANQVVEGDESVESSLYYAINVLKVNYVLILGHTHCGGVQATKADSHPEVLENWIQHVRTSVSDFAGEVPEDGETLERYNVEKQVQKVQQLDVYKQAERQVPVFGALFHIENGELEWVVKPEEDVFE
ncbi:carbonic anhydrase [Alkalicoccus luteus]|uniref:carbonic anhydrase n=1 Tax=Alkalicoccus luteus TaxID=1237094 RepID=A0A969TVT6_9BACI|nr:carbonic anhydrase [Alkalicoccus luteus]NJP38740.1 carbonic anhydrase [Alkalicoccus luteus]